MTCPACDRAAVNPRTGIYQAGCLSCDARHLAQGPSAKSRQARPQDIQADMRKLWPDEATYRKGRALVWEWIGKIEGLTA